MRTRGTPERFAIRELVNGRGREFTLALFRGVDEANVAAVYYGADADDDAFRRIQAILRERMTND